MQPTITVKPQITDPNQRFSLILSSSNPPTALSLNVAGQNLHPAVHTAFPLITRSSFAERAEENELADQGSAGDKDGSS